MKWRYIILICLIICLIGGTMLMHKQSSILNIEKESNGFLLKGINALDISNNHTKLDLTENKISIDNPVIYLDSPYNITNSGEYIINLENKENLGLAEIIFLTNSSDYLFRDFQLNNPKNITYQSSFTCKDKFPKIEKGFVTCVYPNGSIEFKHSFESNKDNTFFWNDSYIREWEDLILNKKVLTNEFSKEQTNMGISYSFNLNLTNMKSRKIRFRMDIKKEGSGFQTDKKILEEFWILIKPVNYTEERVFTDKLYIDPWIDSSGTDQNLDYLTDSLTDYYKLEDTGGDLINEVGPLNLTNYGASYNETGIIGNAVGFLGNDYLYSAKPDIGTGAFSFSFWIKWSRSDGDSVTQRLVSSAGPTYFDVQVRSADPIAGKVYFDDGTFTSDSRVTDGEWAFVVMTFDGTYMRYYLNGTEDPQSPHSHTKTANDFGTLTFGKYYGRGVRYYGGLLDEFAFFNKTLNETEILDLYNSHGAVSYNKTAGGAPPEDTCTCAGVDTNWEVDLSDYCIVSDDCELGTGNLSFINSGNFTCNANINISNLNKSGLNDGDIMYVTSGCLMYVK